MKKNFLTNTLRASGSIMAMAAVFTFTACDNDGREVDEDEVDDMEVVTTDVEPASNTAYEAPTRDYDTESMGTAYDNRQKMMEEQASSNNNTSGSASSNQQMSDTDYEAAYKEYSDVNQEIRDALRTNPGIDYRYTDDYKTSDYSYDYYGVYYDNVSDQTTADKMRDMEKRRMESRNKLRGQMNKTSKAYVSAEVDPVPKKGFDALYEFLEDEIDYPRTAQVAEIEGTIFVDFVVDANGTVRNAKVSNSIDGQTEPVKGPLNPTQVSENEREEAIKEMEKEAIKAVNATSGMWEPGMMSSQSVATEVSLPVRFRISDI